LHFAQRRVKFDGVRSEKWLRLGAGMSPFAPETPETSAA
jgi:hypothetical protein